MTRLYLITEPATGWSMDNHGLAHQLRYRGPTGYTAWCGTWCPGPAVAEICAGSRECRRCEEAMVRHQAEGVVEQMFQGRLF